MNSVDFIKHNNVAKIDAGDRDVFYAVDTKIIMPINDTNISIGNCIDRVKMNDLKGKLDK